MEMQVLMIGIAQPTFSRTSTAPVVSFNSPSPYASQGFQTNHEIMQQAQGIINKEAWRSSTRELQPYGSTSSSLDEQSLTERRASTGADASGVRPQVRFDQRGIKRTQEEEGEEGEEEEGTEIDEDEYQDPQSLSIAENDLEVEEGVNGQTEFPPVFKSPNLSQPELFHRQTQARFAVPELPNRAKRGLPARNNRTLGKTVSAPVGGLGGFGGGMDIDGGEDGFDVSEWAGKEDF
jgi:hypothetical protein